MQYASNTDNPITVPLDEGANTDAPQSEVSFETLHRTLSEYGWRQWFGVQGTPSDDLTNLISSFMEQGLYAPQTWDAPVLRQPAHPVDEITEETLALIDRMKRTMAALEGIGIAAPQLGVSQQIVCIDVEGSQYTLINPRIVKSRGVTHGGEGCLSFPGLFKWVRRRKSVTVEAFGVQGEPLVIEAEGLLARCLQHEIDHLKGMVLPDKGF